jgi:hypothetical protein
MAPERHVRDIMKAYTLMGINYYLAGLCTALFFWMVMVG